MLRIVTCVAVVFVLGISNLYESLAQAIPGMPPGLRPQPVNAGFTVPVARKGEILAKVTPLALTLARTNAQKRYGAKKPSVAAVRAELAKLFGLRTSSAVDERTVHFKGISASSPRLNAAISKGLAERIEPNYQVNAFQTAPNDTLYKLGLMWGLSNSGASGGTNNVDVDAPEAWSVTEGRSDVVVAVMDTGVSQTHIDLKSRLWENPREIAGNNLDDDNNGYIDDVRGWDFVSNDNIPADAHMHGTHVAGTIAAEKNNGKGIVGVAPGVKIVSLKVLDSKGSGDYATVMKALRYAIALRRAGVNLRVVNMSLGGGDTLDAFTQMLEEADNAGILIVAAAGNDKNDNDAKPTYPANYDVANVISVAAIDQKGLMASFSNYGARTVDVAAPGVFIWSTFPFGFYFFLDGTSMAAPHVSGVAALMYSRNPNLRPSQVVSILRSSVKRIAGLEGKMVAPGVVSAAKALELVG
jgi:subtilisin family serine protease